jgi:hypothetical protein
MAWSHSCCRDRGSSLGHVTGELCIPCLGQVWKQEWGQQAGGSVWSESWACVDIIEQVNTEHPPQCHLSQSGFSHLLALSPKVKGEGQERICCPLPRKEMQAWETLGRPSSSKPPSASAWLVEPVVAQLGPSWGGLNAVMAQGTEWALRVREAAVWDLSLIQPPSPSLSQTRWHFPCLRVYAYAYMHTGPLLRSAGSLGGGIWREECPGE